MRMKQIYAFCKLKTLLNLFHCKIAFYIVFMYKIFVQKDFPVERRRDAQKRDIPILPDKEASIS